MHSRRSNSWFDSSTPKRVLRCIIASTILFSGLTIPLSAHAEDIWVESRNNENTVPKVKIDLPSFAPAVEKLGQSVVNIQTEGSVNLSNKMNGQPMNPLEELFRGRPQRQDRRFNSLGSGFVIHPDGFIVTNHHVVDRATKIMVSFRDDNKAIEAKLIGSDPKTDLALIKVDTDKKLVAASVGDSEQLRAGDWVIAIGNPFRLGHTATVGIVSAKHRRLPTNSAYNYTNFIQTDASINPGNSGGPLFNSNGEVIGVNTAIFSPGNSAQGGFNIGIGFAIPINLAKGIISQIKDNGKVIRGWLGVMIQPVTEDAAEVLELDEISGALVAQVMPNSPASEAGFRRRDVIKSFDGHQIEQNDDLPMIVADTEVGKKVAVNIIRDGSKKTLYVTIQQLPDKEESEQVDEDVEQESILGLVVQNLTPEIAGSMGVEEDNGVVVSMVEPDSPAADAMLRRGDIILEVNSSQVNSVEKFKRKIEAVRKSGKPVLLLVRRGDATLFFTMKTDDE